MKKLVISLMSFVLVITLTGCGGGGGGTFRLDRGDNGESLDKNGFGDIRAIYKNINSELNNYNPSNDPDGSRRTTAIIKHVDSNYGVSGSFRAAYDKKDFNDLKARLKDLISRKKFEGIEIIPMKLLDGVTGDKIFEKTKLYVTRFVHDGSTYLNKEYVFDAVEWIKEGENWKIKSGLNDLFKTVNELMKK